jgi:hypothetical protein
MHPYRVATPGPNEQGRVNVGIPERVARAVFRAMFCAPVGF